MDKPAFHFFGMNEEALRGWCSERGMPGFRAKQIASWVYEHGVCDPAQMSNLSKADRQAIADDLTFLSGSTIAHQVATDGTQKLLIQWGVEAQQTDALEGTLSHSLPVLNASGFDYTAGDPTRQTECVMIPAKDVDSKRNTACISSQVGCPVGCRFCASGLSGLDGNLSTGRIVEQVWRLQQLPEVERISNVVFMGMGEPLSNFRAVTDAVRTLTRPKPWGLGISARKITISTVGMHKAIEKLADELELPVTLALSLHAPNDELRRELIPWAEFTTVDQLLTACDKWFQRTGREITLEYTLLKNKNDRPRHAEELAKLARRLRANINLIRYNEVNGLPFERPEDEDVRRFQDILRQANLNVHIRASRGRDIAAACGQLRHETASA